MTIDVVGIGYCVYDILAVVPGVPAMDDVHVTHVPELVYDGGGQVGTALTALARLGARTGYVGLLGDDREGRWLAALFEEEGVDSSHLQMRSDAGTNVCLVLVEQGTGRRSILCHPRVRASDLVLTERDRQHIQGARVLHLDGQFMPAALQAAQWAKEAGVRVCYDGNHPRQGLDALLPWVDWLIVAETFPAALTGNDRLDAAVHDLMERGPTLVGVTLGAAGCRLWTRDAQVWSPGFPVRTVDTTGAGDAFHGAFLYALLQEWELAQAGRFANAVAALNCQTLGGRRGLPTRAEAERLMADAGREPA